jgi:hypothetical protein
MSNGIDGPFSGPVTMFVDELEIRDQCLLRKHFGAFARYYHKEKAKTTIIDRITLDTKPGDITCKPGSKYFQKQLHRIVNPYASRERFQEMLDRTNLFIDHFVALVSGLNWSAETRRVSFYDGALYVTAITKIDNNRVVLSSKIAQDAQSIEQPFPLFWVASNQQLAEFKTALQQAGSLQFHQLQWTMAINRLRERRYQGAMLAADTVLEALMIMSFKRTAYT